MKGFKAGYDTTRLCTCTSPHLGNSINTENTIEDNLTAPMHRSRQAEEEVAQV